jgi:glycosyltransferase involved in cell wall biosynthesis
MPFVDIALGLYNGAKYLPEFLDSLSKQTFQDWRLVVRDDGSRDDSLAIVERWAAHNLRPLKVVSDSRGNLRVNANFSECLGQTNAPYVMPADQDDFWFPNKIETAIAEVRRIEGLYGEAVPIAVYCDLQVVDERLQEIHPSFLAMQGQGSRRLPTLAQLLAQNVAPGCSMIVNRALLRVALPIPEQAAMHDWWLMLNASTLGQIGHIAQPGLAYRQHGGNQVGAKSGGIGTMLARMREGRAVYRRRFLQSQRQALALFDRLAADNPNRGLLRLYGTLEQQRPGARQVAAWRAGFSKVGHIRNLAFYLLM